MLNTILPEHLSNVMTGVAVLGFGLASLAAEPRSRATQMLCLGLVMQGLTMALATLKYVVTGPEVPWPARLLGLTDAIAFASWLQWFLLVARSNRPGRRALAWMTRCCRTVQVLACVYAAAAIAMPLARLEFLGMGDLTEVFRGPPAVFSILWLLMLGIGTVPSLILLTQKIDPAERVRLYGLEASIPLMILSPFLTPNWSAFSMLVGLVLFAFGALRYHVEQGRRGQFMSRFLSPAVAEMVGRRGLEYTMQPRTLEATIVSCDLRGFTPYSRLTASDALIRLIGEYYDAVGTQVAKHGATIKDYAGDGVLILVGAPLPVPNAACSALALAADIRGAVRAVLRGWQREDAPLDIGIGVASGPITVGALGSESRLEYMAIGDAVNLATRFGNLAPDGEIWVDERTSELAALADAPVHEVARVKGIGDVRYRRYPDDRMPLPAGA